MLKLLCSTSLSCGFMTANDSVATCRAAQDAGCIAYLPKPFSAQLLIEAIKLAGAQDLE